MASSSSMTPGGGRPGIRPARHDELALLSDIEREADALFAEVGIGPFAPDGTERHLAQAAAVLVAGEPPVGFASVEEVDGSAHLWQLSVHPAAARRGVGTALVGAVCDWALGRGYGAVTLTTYRNVPWNAPFYRRLGFRELSQLTPGLHAIREHEKSIGDDSFGERVAMRKEINPAQ
jgi:GNAT superfamily N-acetyltransferase